MTEAVLSCPVLLLLRSMLDTAYSCLLLHALSRLKVSQKLFNLLGRTDSPDTATTNRTTHAHFLSDLSPHTQSLDQYEHHERETPEVATAEDTHQITADFARPNSNPPLHLLLLMEIHNAIMPQHRLHTLPRE